MSNETSLAGASIVLRITSHSLTRLAARELARYLYQLSGKVSLIREHPPSAGVVITLRSQREDVSAHLDDAADQKFTIRATGQGLTISGATPLGTLYGVYALLEHLGMGFYLGGDTFPDPGKKPVVSTRLTLSAEPHFAVRGNNLHGNLMCGSSAWGDDDWRFYLDQMARMRCNLFMVHIYDNEPGAGYEWDGQVLAQGRPHSSLNPAFGVIPHRTAEFSFGSGVFFDQEVFGPPPVERSDNVDEQIRGMESILREAIRYGRARGVLAAVGFEFPPTGDPTDAATRRRFQTQVRQFVKRYPDLAYFTLWQCEARGIWGEDLPSSDGVKNLIAGKRRHFAYLGGNRRIWAGIQWAEFAWMAYEVLRTEAPHLRLAICGWGGERWMMCEDYFKGLHEVLPKDVIFTSHGNIDATAVNTVAEMYGHLPKSRQRWAQVWLESDTEDTWTRQAHVESLGRHLPDALAKHCQGALTLHWRTRDFEEEVGYLARYAWQSDLTTAAYYADCGRQMFGEKQGVAMGRELGNLQRLGGRWTGINGGWECGSFKWTGRVPHWAFEVNKEAVLLILQAAQRAQTFFAENGFARAAAIFGQAAAKLAALVVKDISGKDVPVLKVIEAALFQIRRELVMTNSPILTWTTVDQVISPLHHLTTWADHARRTKEVMAIRKQIVKAWRRSPFRVHVEREERYEFLLGSIDALLALDRVSILLASPGPVEEQLSQAERAQQAGDAATAIKHAAAAYEAIRNSGIQEMLEAQSRKLGTRCEWGVFALMNLKAMPCYWQTLERAERFLPAIPPRQLHVQVSKKTVRVHWLCAKPALGYHVYRRRVNAVDWQRITRSLVHTKPDQAGHQATFVDRPRAPGAYEYMATAVDRHGWESSHSHATTIRFGIAYPLRVLGVQQGFGLLPNQPHEVRVVVPPLPDGSAVAVTLFYRQLGANIWTKLLMSRRFRCSYHALIPPVDGKTTGVEYYVEAETTCGQKAVWPVTASIGRYWVATIIPMSSESSLPPCGLVP